ncbi:MAG: CBS domain-containing protein [Deltaproteobacteria bacterium]
MSTQISNTTVADLATQAVVTVQANAKVGLADAKMRLADIRHLPVVDDEERVVGIVSHRDLLVALGESLGNTVAIRSVMREDVVIVRPETRAYEAAALMLDRKIGALPVVDHSGKLTGIITETDFLRVAYELLGGRVLD